MHTSLTESIPMTEAQFGLLTTAFLVVYGVLSPFAGFLGDRFSRSRIITGSLLVWSFITWLTVHAKTYDQLLTTRLLMGISEASYMPTAMALVADYHRGATRSLAIGVVLNGVTVGAALGGLGGWLADRHGWGYTFRLFGFVGIVFSAVLALLLRDAPSERDKTDPSMEPVQRVRFGEAVTSLFSRGAFILAFTYWGLFSVTGWMTVGWMPTYFQEHFHLTQGTAGLLATIYYNVAALLGLLVGGAWADRWGLTNKRACILVSIIGLCAAMPGILLVSYTSLLPLAISGLALYGLTTSFANTEMMPILCLISDTRYRATGFGILNLCACLVGGATIYAGGVLRDARVDVNKLFLFGAVGLGVCAVLISFVRPRADVAS